MTLPLAGIRVLALEQAAAGPFATQILADMGADVVKVERPRTGDVIRSWDRAVRGLSSGFVWLNRSKKSVAVDLKDPRGRQIVERLLEDSDVLVVNLSPGSIERLGLAWDDVRERFPRLIYCGISGYGSDGPYRNAKAYDLLIQGEAGVLATTGYPDAPAKVGIPVADIAAGTTAALGITLAILHRLQTGRGQFVDVSMFESLLAWLAYFPHHFWHQGEEPERVGMRHHYMVPYGPYRARDGEFVSIAVASDANWRTFCERVVERPDWLRAKKYRDSPSRRENRIELERAVESEFLKRDSAEWLKRMDAADLPYGQLRTIGQVLAHPQMEARRLVRYVQSPVGELPTIESPIRMSDVDLGPARIPGLGEDTFDVLRGVGYSADELADLRGDGVVFGPTPDEAAGAAT